MNRFAGAAGREVPLDAMNTIIDLINDSDAWEDWNNNVFFGYCAQQQRICRGL